MNTKSLLILILLAGLAGLGAWFMAFQGGPAAAPTRTTAAGDRLAPMLAERGQETARIEIISEENTVELTHDGEAWRIASKGGYPADADKVRRLVTTLSELRTAEAKTALPERHALLSVQWPDGGEPGADEYAPRPTLVLFSDDAGEPIAAIVLGATSFTGGTTRQYARLLGDDQSWLLSSRIDAPTDGMRWLNARFIELPREAVRRVTISHPEGESVSLSREDAEGDFVVEDIPENMAPISEGVANRVGSALSFVNFTDVEADPGDRADAVISVYETFDGMTITLRVQADDDGTWVSAEAEGEGSDELRQRFEGYRFRLPTPAAESLTRRVSDLLTEIAPDEQGPTPDEGAVPELLRPPGDG